jgi:hypothetical protein
VDQLGASLGTKATAARQLFEQIGKLVSKHKQKKSKLNAVKLMALSVFP